MNLKYMGDQPTIVKKLFWINLLNNCFWLSSVITFFYLHRGLSYTEILALEGILSIVIILCEVPTGMIADKYGRKTSMILSSMFLISSMIIYVFANSLILFGIAFALSGIGLTFASGSTEALLYDSLKSLRKKKYTQQAIGNFMSAEVLAGIITPPLASIIAKDLTAFQFIFLIILTLVSYFAALLITITVKEKRMNKPSQKKTASFNAFKNLFKNKALRTLALNRMLVGIAMSAFVVLWQPQLQASKVPISLFGVILASGSLGIFWVNRNINVLISMIHARSLLVGSTILPGLGFFILAFAYHPIVAVLTYVLIRIVVAAREPILAVQINHKIESHQRATMLSLISMITALAAFILMPLIGLATDKGLAYGFIILGGLCFLASFVFPLTKRIVENKRYV